MIEDPSPPAYEPVSLNDDDAQSLPGDDAATAVEADEAARDPSGSGTEARAVTSSLRGTHRTLLSTGGWTSYFRGFGCWMAISVATVFLHGILTSTFLPALLAGPICAVAVVQLYTAWVHVVISAPSPRPFWRRLTPFQRTFQAAALPMVLYFLALEISSFVPRLVGKALGLPQWRIEDPSAVPAGEPSDAWKALVVFLLASTLRVFLVIPAHVVLTRVQASLLPEEDETIVPFDRAFQGRLEPAIVGGKGYVTVADAWRTFSRASWVRLIKLYLKVFAVGVLVTFVWIMLRYAKKIEE